MRQVDDDDNAGDGDDTKKLTVYLAYMLCVHLARLVYTGGGRYSCPVPGKHPFLSPELATSSSSPYRVSG
ncbi:hypothetical protein J6590_081500 [Homalodisca vitripennis]|nr:hypothetical protein J6590_081500 [Homalodisca vitripennis]